MTVSSIRRRWTAIWLAAVVGLTIACFALIGTRESRVVIREEQLSQIQIGMDRQEVQELLGVPPGDYRSGRPVIYPVTSPWPGGERAPAAFSEAEWITDDVSVRLEFDERGKLLQVSSIPGILLETTWWERTKNRVSRWFK
jgi:hypothetical protein